MLHRHLLAMLLALSPAAAAAGEADAAPAPAAPAEATAAPAAQAEKGPADAWSAMATLREEWRGRFASSSGGPSESDHTARLFIDADASSPAESVALHGSMGLWWRFAKSCAGEDGRCLGLSTPRDDFWLDVYTLSLEWRPGGVVGSLAAGRLTTEHGPAGTYDGLSLSLKPTHETEVFVFGGRAVHFFAVDEQVFDNWMASVGAGVRGSWWKLEADYRLLREEVATAPADSSQGGKLDEDGGATKREVVDHSYGLSAAFRYSDWFNARVQVRGIDDRFQTLGAALHLEYVPLELGLDAKVDVQPSTLGELNPFDSPYFLTLGESRPHLKARVDLFKNFTTRIGHYGIHLGGDARALLNAEESPFNRNLLRAYLVLSAGKIGGTGLFLSAVGEMDRARDPDTTRLETRWAAGGALGWDQKPVKAEVGTNYYAWRYVYYQSPEERADVREFYGDVKVNVVDWLALRARYSYEVFDRTVHTVTVSISEAL